MSFRLEFTNQAADALDGLYKTEPTVARRVDGLLDVLESDPEDPRVRQRHWARTPELWGFTVRGRDEDWTVLWEPDDVDPDVLVVRWFGAVL